MKLKNLLLWLVVILATSGITLVIYKKIVGKPNQQLFKTVHPSKRTIAKTIDTSGKLNVAERIKIGSLVTGTLKKLYAEENEYVEKGKLLAEIDTGKSDTEVREAKGLLERASAALTYEKERFKRQKALYKSKQLSTEEFEKSTKDIKTVEANLHIAKAAYDKKKQEYDNTKIYAPDSGIIINVGVSEGERVTTDLNATVLFQIAKDITKMEAGLEIDEVDVGYVKKGQKVKFTIDTFPNKQYKTIIHSIGYSPKTKSGTQYYKATIFVDNSEKLLRPGLSINAKIAVAKQKNALTLPSQVFMINSKVLKEIAKVLKYSFKPCDRPLIKMEKKKSDKLQVVWVKQGNSFIEKPIKTNITDDIFYQIVDGISEKDEVVVDIEETNQMEEIMKKAFGAKF